MADAKFDPQNEIALLWGRLKILEAGYDKLMQKLDVQVNAAKEGGQPLTPEELRGMTTEQINARWDEVQALLKKGGKK